MMTAAAVTSCTSRTTAADTPSRPSLRWGECPGPAEAALECARLAVPLDYRHPHGRTIDVEVSRLPSGKPAEKRGVLLLNPGGPGLPGLRVPVLLNCPRRCATAMT
ncbi:alpha/beta fold hydrolase [Streptomyces californicus]